MIDYIIEDNKIEELKDLKLNKILITDATREYVKENYSFIDVRKENQKLVKVINSELGCGIVDSLKQSKSNAVSYKWSDMFYELESIYQNKIVFKME